MSVLVVGLSHRSASVGLLERTALAEDDIAKLLTQAVATEHVDEALVLATCNRLEVYADARKFHGGVQELTDALVQRTGVTLEELAEHLYVHYEDRAVQHLFAVASMPGWVRMPALRSGAEMVRGLTVVPLVLLLVWSVLYSLKRFRSSEEWGPALAALAAADSQAEAASQRSSSSSRVTSSSARLNSVSKWPM